MQIGIDLNDGYGGLKVEPVISSTELIEALDGGLEMSKLTSQEIIKQGWKAVHRNDVFALYKRRVPANNGAVQYLLTGSLPDVSPRTFLHSNVDYDCRKKWDVTMHDMNVLGVPSGGSGVGSGCMEGDEQYAEDLLYYRTRWPWPLKDRDYTLARRCGVFEEKSAIVLVSRSTEAPNCAVKNGVIRVDNYWCRSAFISSPSSSSSSFSASSVPSVDRPGMKFVTVFCDDQKVPLPPMVVDILSAQGEKVVPDSISRLHAVARGIESMRRKNGAG
eukprot:CAMPEP_0182428182 /NCGR_PEP_ID=MMETSP1167-20130531/21295_1 /TAXON_ID=2988 /ORGANISM="Mallomonas Sp, Strain CCMP3275" /LENGTH=273 /DNA_ID=CAMNT_0024610917 /DNA_START=295 /DNA_END=1116 /DNA_ORIENTATION=-